MKTIIFLAFFACAFAVEVVVPNKVQVLTVVDEPHVVVPSHVPGVGVGVGVVPGEVQHQHQHAHKVWPAEVNNVVKEHVDHIVTNIKVQRVPQHVGHVVGTDPVVNQHVPQGVQPVGGKVPVVDKVPHVIIPNVMITKVEQVSEGVSQVNTVNKVPQIPSLVQEIVQHAHTHIPQVIQHHQAKNKVPREMDTVPGVGQVPAHVPQVIREQVVTHVVGKGPNVNLKIPHVVNGVVVQDVINDKVHTLHQHVKDIMKQVEQHIPQVVQHAREQQKQKQGGQGVVVPQVMKDVVAGDKVAQVGDKVVPQIPSHVQEVVNQVHEHIPQVIQHHNSVHTTPKVVTN